jgi:hypothetical protein
MKRKLLLACAILLVASGLFLLVRVIYTFKDVGKGGLQVTANIKGKVMLDGKYIGNIPLKLDQKDTIPVGTYEIRVEPEDTSLAAYTVRTRINGGVLTAIDKTFLPGSLGSSYILTLEQSSSPKPQIEITTIPDGALITIDSIAVGTSPYKSDALSPSEHEVEIQKEGFAKKTVRIRTVEKHTLVLTASLGTGDIGAIPEATSPPAQGVPISTSPSPSPTEEVAAKVTILPTPNGFLRVRSGAGTSFGEVARVKPGETYDYIGELSNWYEIRLNETTTGWITNQYAKKN